MNEEDQDAVACAWCATDLEGVWQAPDAPQPVVLCDDCYAMACAERAGPVQLAAFEATTPREDMWPLPLSGRRRFVVAPPFQVTFRVLRAPPADADDDRWLLPCLLAELDDPRLHEVLDYAARTGGTPDEVLTALSAALGFAYQTDESDALHGDLASARLLRELWGPRLRPAEPLPDWPADGCVRCGRGPLRRYYTPEPVLDCAACRHQEPRVS